MHCGLVPCAVVRLWKQCLGTSRVKTGYDQCRMGRYVSNTRDGDMFVNNCCLLAVLHTHKHQVLLFMTASGLLMRHLR